MARAGPLAAEDLLPTLAVRVGRDLRRTIAAGLVRLGRRRAGGLRAGKLGLDVEHERLLRARAQRNHLARDRLALAERLQHTSLERSLLGSPAHDVHPVLILANHQRDVLAACPAGGL